MSILIKRYRFDEYYNEGDGEVEDEAGEYVKFNDIKELLNTDVQRLKAKIRLSLEQIKGAALNGDKVTMFHIINKTYAELSAIE
jgi:hypothetical protein